MRKLDVVILEDLDTDFDLVDIYLKKSKQYLIKTTRFTLLKDLLNAYESKTLRGDVILLDLNLPDSDYHHTLYRVLNTIIDIPIIVLTSMDLKYGYDAIKLGAQDFINKTELKNEYLDYKLLFAMERSEQLKHLESIAFMDSETSLHTLAFLRTYIEQQVKQGVHHFSLIRYEFKTDNKEMFEDLSLYVASELRYTILDFKLIAAVDSNRVFYVLVEDGEEAISQVDNYLKSVLSNAKDQNEALNYQVFKNAITCTGDLNFESCIKDLEKDKKEVKL